MELRHYLAVLRRRAVLMLLMVLVAVVAAWVATPKAHKYSARSVIYVGSQKFSLSPTDQYLYPQLVDRLIATYSKMLDSEPIANDAISTTRVPRSAQDVVKETSVTQQKDTQLLTVQVTDSSRQVAQQLANGISDAFVQKVKSFDAQPGPGSLPSLPAYVFQRADPPTSANSTGLLRNVLLAAFFGLLVAVAVAFLLDYLDVTVKTIGEAEARLQLPVLGFIPYDRSRSPGQLLAGAGVRILKQQPQRQGVAV